MKTYFVTGATGVVGSALVPALLEDRDARVRLLIRATSEAELARRLDELFAFWGLGAAAESDARSRVSALAGDTTLAAFGLPPERYRELGQSCTHIVHSAGSVRMNLPLEAARAATLASARHVVELAEAAQAGGLLQKVEFVSTVGVGGRLPGILPEAWITAPRAYHNTYEQAKAEAEDFLRERAEARALPVTVHRPSMVVGDARAGRVIHFQVFYHLCEFVSGRRTGGWSPALGDARLDTVPADYVAGLIAWSSRTRETAGRVLHACSGPAAAIRLVELRALVRTAFAAAGIRLPAVRDLPHALFRAALVPLRLVAPRDLRRAIGTLPVFLDYLAEDQSFGNDATRALVEPHGLVLPAPGAYLDKVLAFYLARRSVPARAAAEGT